MYYKQLSSTDIIALRNFVGLSTRKLAKEAGLSNVTLHYVEHDMTPISERTTIRLLLVFTNKFGMTVEQMETVIEMNKNLNRK